MSPLRTTITLDPDVAESLRQRMRRTGETFKTAVNETLRLGLLDDRRSATAGSKPFAVQPRALGIPYFERTEDLLDALEGPNRRW